MKNFDFVGIGDIVTDAFIRLRDADLHLDEAKQQQELCVRFGDKIPYKFVKIVPAVGNATNACVAASRLGLNSAYITNQGDDMIGKENIKALEEDRVSTDYVFSHTGIKSNYHYVLWYGADRTILIKHEVYPYIMPQDFTTKWLYLSSLGSTSELFHADIERYLEAFPNTKLAFQPGTFQISLGIDKLKNIYAKSEIFFCNKDEAQRILSNKEEDPKKLSDAMRSLGPKIVVITDGPAGAYAFDGANYWFVPAYPDPAPPLSRTGAGDSFSSTVTAALALGKPLEEALLWGPVNSAYVVQKIGARKGLLHREELEKLLASAPETYKLKTI
ncbi:MAG: carbohydrate kinase family protein [Candidatus Vogelbacteria bacterium]|nr:carbohydrate kinase family protein [Candidatus Vogelbacteria bacterium]